MSGLEKKPQEGAKEHAWPRRPKILIYMGGFAAMGGIEIFVRDLAAFLGRSGAEVTLAYWPIRARSPILNEIADTGCRLVRGAVTRGVRFDLPDRSLLLRTLGGLRAFDLVVFAKLFSDPVMASILNAIQSDTARACSTLYVPSFCPEEDETYHHSERPRHDLLNRIDAVMAQSPTMASQVGSFLGYKGRVFTHPLLTSIPDSNPLEMPRISGDRPRLRMGFIGRLTAQKNVRGLLDAYRIFLEEHEPKLPFVMDLHIHGDGAEAAELRAHSCPTAHPGRVEFHGAYENQKLVEIARDTHFFVQTTRFEGQCLAALEVMALGRAMLATRAGCLDDVINEAALGEVLPQDRPDLFAAAMAAMGERIIGGKFEPARCAASFDSRFSRRVTGPKYLEMIRSLIKW